MKLPYKSKSTVAEMDDGVVMREALVKIARQKVGYRSTQSILIQNIAREALVAIGWDWFLDQPVEQMAQDIEDNAKMDRTGRFR